MDWVEVAVEGCAAQQCGAIAALSNALWHSMQGRQAGSLHACRKVINRHAPPAPGTGQRLPREPLTPSPGRRRTGRCRGRRRWWHRTATGTFAVGRKASHHTAVWFPRHVTASQHLMCGRQTVCAFAPGWSGRRRAGRCRGRRRGRGGAWGRRDNALQSAWTIAD